MFFEEDELITKWGFLPILATIFLLFAFVAMAVINLQVVQGGDLSYRSGINEVKLSYVYPNRGIITDRQGNVLAENIPAVNLLLDPSFYYDYEAKKIKYDLLKKDIVRLEEVVGESSLYIEDVDSNLDLYDYVLWYFEGLGDSMNYGLDNILLLSDIDNNSTVRIKSWPNDHGFLIEESSKRYYPAGSEFSHLLGYISLIWYEDLERLDYLGYEGFLALNGYQDKVGRVGLEAYYDDILIGRKGVIAADRDVYGNTLYESDKVVQQVIHGSDIQVSIDTVAQKKMYEILEEYVEQLGATGAAGMVMDIESGELIVAVTEPTYNNNDFIGGISSDLYAGLTEDPRLPLFNRMISAQLPPGSTFKTLTLLGAYDASEVDSKTIYRSRNDYTFSNGVKFQEYRNNSYGNLDMYGAIARSSNIYFCEVIRNWDIYKLVPYYEKFGIGERTGVDLIGEMPGRLPSPESKSLLASDPNITWLEEVWYPEGDGCNTVIGQGITLVTPVQMLRWNAAIANGGSLVTPHLLLSSTGDKDFKFNTEEVKLSKTDSTAVVRKSMWEAVNGGLRSIGALSGAQIEVAAKTGTAEFGALNADGVYEHTHAWVTGFYPYNEPKYAFVVLLEDGGESFNASSAFKEFIDWYALNCDLETAICQEGD